MVAIKKERIVYSIICWIAAMGIIVSMHGCSNWDSGKGWKWPTPSSKEVSDNSDSSDPNVQISILEPYQNLERFPMEPFVLEFRVLFGWKAKRLWRDVKVYYKSIKSSEFKKVGWGIFKNGKVKRLFETLYAYSVKVPRKDLEEGDIQFYIEVVDDKGNTVRYPEHEEYLMCKEYEEIDQSNEVLEGMVYIPEGYVIMGALEGEEVAGQKSRPRGDSTNGDDDGSNDRQSPCRKVYVKPFFIDKFEVSNEGYELFCKSTNHKRPPYWMSEYVTDPMSETPYAFGKGKFPVRDISFNDAKAYCKWVGKRLPTEAEWERAARGSESLKYPWGNTKAPNMANLAGKDTYFGLAPVKSFARGKSQFGCVNMIGNVAEYVGSPTKKDNLFTRVVLKGGSYVHLYDITWTNELGEEEIIRPNITCYSRAWPLSGSRVYWAGFRCAKDAEGATAARSSGLSMMIRR